MENKDNSELQKQIANCMQFYEKLNPKDQISFVESLLSGLNTNQQAKISSFLQPLLKRDFLSLLPISGLHHVAEKILYYLDEESIKAAETVSKSWLRTILNCEIWKNLLKEKLRTDKLWLAMMKRRGWSDILFQPDPDHAVSNVYFRSLYDRTANEIKILQNNWRNGRHFYNRINCHSQNATGVYCLQYDDKKIVAGLRDKTVKIFDHKDFHIINTLHGHAGSVLCLQYNDFIIISGSSDATMRVWNVETGDSICVILHHTDAVLHLRFDDRILVSCSKDRLICIWKFISKTKVVLVQELRGHTAAVNVIDFDINFIVSGSGDCSIRVWNAQTYALARVIKGHERGIACMQYKNGMAITGSSDTTVRIWNIATGACLRILEGHDSLVRTVRFNSKYIVSGDYEGTIKIWDLQTALLPRDANTDVYCLYTLREHTNRVYRLQFDDFQIVSASLDDSIIIWEFDNDLDDDELIDTSSSFHSE